MGGAGQESDINRAGELISGFKAEHVFADKGYDADQLLADIVASGAQPVIPAKSNRTNPQPCDMELYKQRNLVERFFNKLKHFRRVATRYDKLLANFLGFVKLAAVALWLRPLK